METICQLWNLLCLDLTAGCSQSLGAKKLKILQDWGGWEQQRKKVGRFI